MTAPNSTCLEITDPDVAAMLIKESVGLYLMQFVGAEITIAQAAERISLKLNVMAYWAGRFLKFGLIRITRTETRGGSAIKYYQSVAEEYIIPTHLFKNLTEEALLQHIQQRDYTIFSRNVARAGFKITPDWQLRLLRVYTGHGVYLEPIFRTAPTAPIRRPLHDFANVNMPKAQAEQFYTELGALFERFRAVGHLEPDLPRFIMHVGFVEVSDA